MRRNNINFFIGGHMRKPIIVAIWTCLIFLVSTGTVIHAADIGPQPPSTILQRLYTKTCENVQYCFCDNKNDVLISGGATCPLLNYLSLSYSECGDPGAENLGIAIAFCLGRHNLPNNWQALCGVCAFTTGNGLSCSDNVLPASITITCLSSTP